MTSDVLVMQPFVLCAMRRVARRDLEADPSLWAKTRDDLDQVLLQFKTLFPVWKWRREPERDEQLDFVYDVRVFQLYARGWLDMAGPIEEHPTLLIEA